MYTDNIDKHDRSNELGHGSALTELLSYIDEAGMDEDVVPVLINALRSCKTLFFLCKSTKSRITWSST